MLIRLFSGLVLVAVFLGFCFGGLGLFAFSVTGLAFLGVCELTTAYGHVRVESAARSEVSALPGPFLPNAIFAGLGVLWPLLTYREILMEPMRSSPPWIWKMEAGLQVCLVILFTGILFRAARTGKALGGLQRWYGLLGWGYVGMLFSSFVLMRGLPGQITVAPFGTADRGAWLMFFVTACVWATDTFAYLVGRSVGRHKLAPALSPNKTVEGSFGGLLGAMLVGAAFAHWIHLPVSHGLAVGAIAGTVGQLGDLFKSSLKRELGLKDFGNLLPGHGGILDRFDSLLFVTPLSYLALRFLLGLP